MLWNSEIAKVLSLEFNTESSYCITNGQKSAPPWICVAILLNSVKVLNTLEYTYGVELLLSLT